jgi:predicted molibdopterin-dependent oxidoreductase YjgC
MSYTADVREGVQWKTRAEDGSAGAPKLALRLVEPVPLAGSQDSLILVAPRILYDGGRLLAEAEVVASHLHPVQILLARSDAQKLGIATGDQVTISVNGTSIELPAQISRTATEGVALVPRNLAGRPAETLLGPSALFAAVKVEKK